MTAVVVAAGLGVAVLVIGWVRFIAGRSERRSVEGYEHVLDVLGDVSKRSDAAAPVQLKPPGSLAQPHVSQTGAEEAFRPATSAIREVPAARVRLDPPVPPGQVPGAFVFEEPADGPHLRELADGGDSAGAKRLRRPAARRRSNPFVARRAAASTAAALVLGAAVIGGWRLASSHAPTGAASIHARGNASSRQQPSAPPIPSSFVPTTVTKQLVTYAVPQSTYSISFSATGACWLGVLQGASESDWAWMRTLAAGASATYQANGTTTVRVGAPKAISVSIDGVSVELPPGNVDPYNVTFVTVSSTST